MNLLMKLAVVMLMTVLPEFVLAADSAEQPLDLTSHWVGLFAIAICLLVAQVLHGLAALGSNSSVAKARHLADRPRQG